MSCTETRRIDDHFAGRLAPGAERRLREHLPTCAACRSRYERHALLERLRPGRASAKDRLARSLGLRRPRRPWSSWLLRPRAQLALVGAAVALLVVILRPGAQSDLGFRPRGGSLETVAQSVELVRVPQQGRPELVLDEIQASDELGVRYRNPKGRRYLLVFARDTHDHFYWYFPAWTDAALDPIAVPIERGAELRELGEVVGHDLDTDALQVTAIFTDTPLSVRTVESLARAQGHEPLPVAGAEILTRTLRVRR